MRKCWCWDINSISPLYIAWRAASGRNVVQYVKELLPSLSLSAISCKLIAVLLWFWFEASIETICIGWWFSRLRCLIVKYTAEKIYCKEICLTSLVAYRYDGLNWLQAHCKHSHHSCAPLVFQKMCNILLNKQCFSSICSSHFQWGKMVMSHFHTFNCMCDACLCLCIWT